MIELLILLAVALLLLVVVATAVLAWEMRHPPRHTAGWALARGRPCDPGDLGLSFEDWTLDVSDARLPVWEIAGVSTGGPIIVLLHGWGESRLDVLPRVEPWLQHASSVVAFDLRGHGDAQGRPSRLGSDEHEDLLRLTERLRDAPVVLVGWSLGGVIAMGAAARTNRKVATRIAGIVTIGAYSDFHTSLRGRLAQQDLPGRPLTDLALFVHRCMGIRPPGGMDFVAALACPALFIHGENDPVVPRSHAAQLASASSAGRAVIVSGGNHCDVREADADQFDEAIDDLLRTITPRGGGDSTATPTASPV